MSTEIKDIQKIINERADSRLENDLRAIYQFLSNGKNYELLKEITINAGTSEKPKNIRLYSLFTSDGFADKITELNRDRYRAKETKDFLNKVESIRTDVDNLLQIQGMQSTEDDLPY